MTRCLPAEQLLQDSELGSNPNHTIYHKWWSKLNMNVPHYSSLQNKDNANAYFIWLLKGLNHSIQVVHLTVSVIKWALE